MKRIQDFESFVNESFLNEAVAMEGFGGIKILTAEDNEVMTSGIPYFSLSNETVTFSKTEGDKNLQIDFRGDDFTTEQKGVWSKVNDLKKDVDEWKSSKLVTTPRESFDRAYEILAHMGSVYTGKNISQLSSQQITDLVKTVMKISGDPKLRTYLTKNTTFKSFSNGLKNTLDVKKSLGEVGRFTGVDPNVYKNAVESVLKEADKK